MVARSRVNFERGITSLQPAALARSARSTCTCDRNPSKGILLRSGLAGARSRQSDRWRAFRSTTTSFGGSFSISAQQRIRRGAGAQLHSELLGRFQQFGLKKQIVHQRHYLAIVVSYLFRVPRVNARATAGAGALCEGVKSRGRFRGLPAMQWFHFGAASGRPLRARPRFRPGTSPRRPFTRS